MSAYPWSGRGKKLTDYDIPRIGYKIGVGEDVIHSILDTESRGVGFDKHGVIRLFEEHCYYRSLPRALRRDAVKKGLAYPKWRRNYKNNYARLVKAYEYHPEAALLSCSWGLGQVLGLNYRMVGYHTAEQMVSAFAESEANQLDAVIEFIKASGIDDELRALDKATDRKELISIARLIARVYNGSGYEVNKYHIKIVDSLLWWRGKPDTTWTPDPVKKPSGVIYECCYKYAGQVRLAHANDYRTFLPFFGVDKDYEYYPGGAPTYLILPHMITKIERIESGHLEDM